MGRKTTYQYHEAPAKKTISKYFVQMIAKEWITMAMIMMIEVVMARRFPTEVVAAAV